jgi:hypothetical protein
VLKKASRNSVADDVPDVRADEPERAMEQFTNGLRRVLAAPKQGITKAKKHRRKRAR